MKLVDSFSQFISSVFGIGYLPFVPGTFGSIAGMAFFYFLKGDNVMAGGIACALFLIGVIASERVERISGRKDPPFVVIDEVVGMFLSLLFLPVSVPVWVAAFLLFRLLDTVKPYPADVLQHCKGGLGIMCDDVVAGVYTNIILQIVLRFTSIRAS